MFLVRHRKTLIIRKICLFGIIRVFQYRPKKLNADLESTPKICLLKKEKEVFFYMYKQYNNVHKVKYQIYYNKDRRVFIYLYILFHVTISVISTREN